MSDQSRIEWTEATWNPVVGCSRVSAGCDHCYAIRMTGRLQAMGVTGYEGLVADGDWTGEVRCLPERLDVPRYWRKPRRIFVNSMSDLFHPGVPTSFIEQVWDMMASTPQHTYQVLTKRPARMAALFGDDSPREPLPNVWLGTSVEAAYQTWRIGKLRDTVAAMRFVSLEPLIGPIPALNLDGIGWVIVGGESGPGARRMRVEWVQEIRDQCVAAGVPFFFKQWGEWVHVDQIPEMEWVSLDAAVNLASDPREYWRVGKRRAGRLLDGQTWDEMPEVLT